ncbi:hypothetical protein N7532_001652 [Penicillium argentinense]|uniref:Uncharacterized protein n=1 Tax=Penicillium argentinense TaxID=1131581 RepID=A0A9W9G302_9EURO|nr:uncharacterized protein N7532_001652 [Penicillium argentinense]KAJ5111117.1 hypothetical protein N7532_001652 [Penicillium argentinense]
MTVALTDHDAFNASPQMESDDDYAIDSSDDEEKLNFPDDVENGIIPLMPSRVGATYETWEEGLEEVQIHARCREYDVVKRRTRNGRDGQMRHVVLRFGCRSRNEPVMRRPTSDSSAGSECYDSPGRSDTTEISDDTEDTELEEMKSRPVRPRVSNVNFNAESIDEEMLIMEKLPRAEEFYKRLAMQRRDGEGNCLTGETIESTTLHDILLCTLQL